MARCTRLPHHRPRTQNGRRRRDAPRGLEFLLLQNRLNVAVSRAEHTAFVVYGTGLLDDLPRTPEGVARLSAFARLVGAA